MGDVFQGSLSEVNNIRQFSLLNWLRNYLPRPVERVLQASAWIWSLDHTSCFHDYGPLSVEFYTPSKRMEYLTTNIAQTDLPHQQQLTRYMPRLRFRDSHLDQEADMKCRWVRFYYTIMQIMKYHRLYIVQLDFIVSFLILTSFFFLSFFVSFCIHLLSSLICRTEVCHYQHNVMGIFQIVVQKMLLLLLMNV